MQERGFAASFFSASEQCPSPVSPFYPYWTKIRLVSSIRSVDDAVGAHSSIVWNQGERQEPPRRWVEPSPCESCSYQDWVDGLEGGRECILYSYDLSLECDWNQDQGCPEDMRCYPADGQGLVEEGVCMYSYAMYHCENTGDCPRGFHCLEDVYLNDSGINVCWADCKLYREEGWL